MDRHQHTLKNNTHVPTLFFHFYLLYLPYLLLNSCGRNDAKQRVFLGRLLVAQKGAGLILADVQSDAVLPSNMHITVFSTDQQLRQ